MKYDLIIVGAGPAGLTAAIYAARYKVNTLLIGNLVGGLAGEAVEVCNFPTQERIKGFELMSKMIKQVKALGVELKQEEVLEVKKGDIFKVKTKKQEYSAKKIILATGSERRKLQIEKEVNFLGKGISYCATCDAGFYKDKVAGVVGGSDAALTAALLLARFAKKVNIIYRKDKFFRAEPTWVEEVEKNKKIKPIFNSEVIELLGTSKLEGVKLDSGKEVELDGLFVEIGSIPMIELATQLKLKLNNGFVAVDKEQKTNVKGVFSAGDLTDNPLKQIITACGEGAIAAQSAYQELHKD